MKLTLSTLKVLSEMICGGSGGNGFNWENFPYRSSWYLTQFFIACDLDFQHDGSTRQPWVFDVVKQLNDFPSDNPSLPSPEIIRVIQQLADPVEFVRASKDHVAALSDLNKVLHRDGLQVLIADGQVIVENLKTQVRTISPDGRLLSREDEKRYEEFAKFLDRATEDEFTDQVLVRLFRVLGFRQITVTGHQDRGMEFGKDLWMKHQLPTSHQLYVGVQVKKGRIHASGTEVSGNVSGILAQLLMLMTYPVFDPETNSKHLFDHVFLVSSGEITKQARTLLSEFLDNTMRRNVMFMDRTDILQLCVQYALPLPNSSAMGTSSDDLNQIPF